MKKNLFTTIFMSLIAIISMAQATSLTIDCQTPGWLSSMINYGDQVTLESLKVTGYINEADLTFIGSLNKNQQLNGVIDLEDVQIVAENNSDNNKLTKGYFGGHIQHLLLPKSLVSATKCLSGASVDSLTIGGEALPEIKEAMFYGDPNNINSGISFNKNVKHLIIRDGVRRIADGAFANGNRYNSGAISSCIFESIDLPSSVTDIGYYAFRNCYKLKNIKLPNNIVSIGEYAFANDSVAFGDTLRLPGKLKRLDFNSFSFGNESSDNYYPYTTYYNYTLINDQVIYIPKDVDTINMIGMKEIKNIVWHIEATNPPLLSISSSWYSGSSLYVQRAKQSITVYVPKSSLDTYKNAPIWKELTILAEPIIANSININQESIEIKKGNTAQLNVIVLPENADDKGYTWSTSNPNVVSISQDGLVTAISSGEAMIFATLNVDNTIVDTCFVKVYQPVTAISLNITTKDVKVGDTFNLVATITPADADNKNVIWSSEDEELASVVDGKVTALKPGVVRILARSEYDNQISAFCEVTITQPVTGIMLNYNTVELHEIGETVQLVATVLPEDASNKEVRWVSSNQSVCIVANGTVVAVGYGTSVIIATTVDGSYMATCTVNVVEGADLPGDVNHDGEVNVADINAIIDIILGGDADDKTRERADVNGDGEVNIADINAVIDIILN